MIFKHDFGALMFFFGEKLDKKKFIDAWLTKFNSLQKIRP